LKFDRYAADAALRAILFNIEEDGVAKSQALHNISAGSTTLDTQALVANARKPQTYCGRNPQTLVMQAIETSPMPLDIAR
jgi:hypothetical protein